MSFRGQTVEEFYGYDTENAASSFTSGLIERNAVSNLFLFKGPNGTSLVVLHDQPEFPFGGPGGGKAFFDFTGLPTGDGQWVVQDDPVSSIADDFESSTDKDPTWRWNPNKTDGGAWRGGLGGSFQITVDPVRFENIKKWRVWSGNVTDSVRFELDLKKAVTISPKCTFKIDIKPGSDPNAVNPDARGTVPVAVLHTDNFDPASVKVGTARFGDPDDVSTGGGATPSHGGHLEDVDNDGDEDLVLHFPAAETGFERDEDEGRLAAEKKSVGSFFGTDTVKLVGGGNGGSPGNSGPHGNGKGPR